MMNNDGSHDRGFTIDTDLFSHDSEPTTVEAAPFTWIEATAIGLNAKLHHHHAKGYEHCLEVHCKER